MSLYGVMSGPSLSHYSVQGVWHRCTTVEVYCTVLIAYRRACHDHKVRVTHFETLLLLLLLLKDVPPSVRSGSDRDQKWGRGHSPCCRTIILEWSRYFWWINTSHLRSTHSYLLKYLIAYSNQRYRRLESYAMTSPHHHQREETHSRESDRMMVPYSTSGESIRLGYIQS